MQCAFQIIVQYYNFTFPIYENQVQFYRKYIAISILKHKNENPSSQFILVFCNSHTCMSPTA